MSATRWSVQVPPRPAPRGGFGLNREAPGGFGMKRDAPDYDTGYGVPEKKPRNLLDWDVKPIAQQPLPKSSVGYGAAPTMQSSPAWYQDPW